MRLSPKALGLAFGIVTAIGWFLTMSFSLLTGIGEVTMTTLGAFHPWFSYSWLGMVIVVIEHLVGGFIVGWFFAWIYNRFHS